MRGRVILIYEYSKLQVSGKVSSIRLYYTKGFISPDIGRYLAKKAQSSDISLSIKKRDIIKLSITI